MVFSAGNVIVLLIVLIVLAVYRQLDRNNRSLEKVKRYAEKVQGDLDAIVEQKSTAIKDMGIELEVHQKAAREVLKRIQTLEDGLSKRAGQIENIGSRIGDYDTALDELLKMTERAEENIARIKEESEYIDSVGKRLKTNQTRIEELEARIPDVVTEFETRNQEALQTVSERAFTACDQRAAQLGAELDEAGRRINDFEDEISVAKDRAEALAYKTEDELRALHEELVKAGQKETASMQHKLDAYAKRFASLEEEYNTRLSRIAEKGENMETEALTRLQAHMDNRISGVSEKLNARLTEYERDAASRVKEIQSLIRERYDGLNADFTSLDQSVNGRIAETEARGKRLSEQVLAKVEQTVTDRSEALKSRLAEQDTSLSDVEARVESTRAELESRIEADRATLESRIQSDRSEIETQINTGREELERRIGSDREELETRMETGRDALETQIKTGRNELAARIESDRSEFEERLAALAELSDGYKSQLDAVKSDTGGEIERIRSEMTRTWKELSGRLAQNAEEIEARVLGQIESRLTEYETAISYRFEKIESVNSDIDELEAALRESMERMSARVKDDVTQMGEELTAQREKERNESREQMDGIRQEMGALEEGISELKERAYDNVSEKLKGFEEDFFADLKQRSLSMDQRLEEWQAGIQRSLDSITEEQRAERDRVERGYGDELKSKLGEFQERLYAQFEKFEEQVTSFQDGLKVRMEIS